MDEFEVEKRNALNKDDKSHEGEWDERIASLCSAINKLSGYFTTSSCAGRITLNRNSTEKIRNAFVYKSHDTCSAGDIISAIKENRGEKIIYFRQEPCALHVSCRSLDDAIVLLKFAKEAGWKRSGIISNNKNKFTCELVSTEWTVAPILGDGQLMVSEEYIGFLISEANKKLERTWNKIERLKKLLLDKVLIFLS